MTALSEVTVSEHPPDQVEIGYVKQLRKIIADLTQDNETACLSLANENGGGGTVALAPAQTKALLDVLEQVSNDKGYQMLPPDTHFSTEEAALMLNVPHPYLLKLLDDGTLPHFKKRRIRSIPAQQLFAYREKDRAKKRRLLEELAGFNQKYNLPKRQKVGQLAAVLDANVIARLFHRNIVLSLAYDRHFLPLWTSRILDKAEKELTRITWYEVDSHEQRLKIERVFHESMIEDCTEYEHGLNLKDPDSNHVLAAAIAVEVPLIVTDNLKGFDESELAKHSVKAISLDSLIASIIECDTASAIVTLDDMRKRLE